MKLEPWPTGIFAFFVVIIGVNIVLLILAVRGFGGMLDQHPYEKGLRYEVELAEERAFREKEWTADISNSPLEVRILQENGTGVEAARVEFLAFRPNDRYQDQDVTLSEAEPGRYRAPVSLGDGRWLVSVVINKDGQTYRLRRDLNIASGRINPSSFLYKSS